MDNSVTTICGAAFWDCDEVLIIRILESVQQIDLAALPSNKTSCKIDVYAPLNSYAAWCIKDMEKSREHGVREAYNYI